MNEQKSDLERAAEIFERASQLQGEAREVYLERACGGDVSLRADIDSMMEAQAEQGEFLASPTQGNSGPDGQRTETGESPRPGERPGTTIGRYKLLQPIGEGGFGVVYMAEQQEPVRRKVALKIIKLGMDTKQVIARFEAERQALAMMEHPNIARVFDAGATETGRPYFVMELVKGIPITEYCDKNNLSTKDRLDLFMPICNAIQHAHQKGIIHRDIKPSNVMVTLHDGKPVPKVIDFGIAKATDHRLTEKTLFTEYHQLVGTPAYMSPEQAEMSGLDVDTRTDIYSLGVLLYELLTGTMPFDPDSLREAAYGEIQRIIREVEPPKPSTRLSTLASETRPSGSGSASLAEIAKHRRTDPSALSRLIRGDLDWIVMKALEKDRTRRYETAKEFAKDVEHHLANEPILAGPPGATYKFRKFVKRNRVAVTAGSLVAAALVVGLTLSTIGFVQASRQRDRAIVAEQEQSRERQRAEAARDEAEQASVAEAEQRKLAESERDLATKAKQEARQQAYVANIAAAGAALSANEIATVRRRLDAAPDELRNWEWRYLFAETDVSLAVFRGHEEPVHSVGFSPDGTRLASTSADKTLRLWDASTGSQLAVLTGHDNRVFQAVFSPDGNRLASASKDRTIRIWDAITGKELAVLRGHERAVASVAFSPDGMRLASGSDDNTVRLWDTVTGEEVRTLRGHEDDVTAVLFSPDGARLASASGGSGEAVDNTIRVWDAATGKELRVLKGHESDVWSEAFSRDGMRLASASADRTVRLWDVATGRELNVFRGHTGEVEEVVFSSDDTLLVSGAGDRTIRVWDIATGNELAVLRGHEQEVYSVALSPDGMRLASASADETLRVWEMPSAEGPGVLRKHEADVNSVALSPDGTRLASACSDQTVRISDAATGEELAILRGHVHAQVLSVAFSPDGMRLATGSGDRTVRIWDAFTGEELGVLKGHRDGVFFVAFSPDGARLASASSDKTVRLWETLTGRELLVMRGHEACVYEVAFSPDGTHLASGSADKTVRLWDVADGSLTAVLRGHDGWVYAVAFSPDGTRLASADGQPVYGQDEDPDAVNTVRLWDVATGQELGSWRGHAAKVSSLAFSPDSTRLASASADGTVRVWDVATGEQLAVLEKHKKGVVSVAFSADGTRLVSGSLDKTVRVWDSVPYQIRYPERRAVLAGRTEAERIVRPLWQESTDAKSVAKRLRADASLTEPQRRVALNLVLRESAQIEEQLHTHLETLYARLVFTEDVVADLEVDESLTANVRARGIKKACVRGDTLLRVKQDSWNLVHSAGGDPDAYKIGLRGAQFAVAAEPDNFFFLTTLGMAQYRMGRYEEAHTTSIRCHEIGPPENYVDVPRHLAVAVMALVKLDRIEEARVMLNRLDEARSEREWWDVEGATALFEEAKQLLEGAGAQTKPRDDTEGEE